MRPHLFLLLAVLGLGGCGPLANHFNQKGAEAFGIEDFTGAKENFKKAVFFEGNNPAFHNNLGYSLYFLGEFDAAEVEYGKAISEKPDAGLARQIKIDQAILYCDGKATAGRPTRKDWNARGIGILQELSTGDPHNAELNMRLGFAYFQAANPGGGFLELDKAVQFATPQEVARYSPKPAQGVLFILHQIQSFYIKIRYFKKADQIHRKISLLEKAK